MKKFITTMMLSICSVLAVHAMSYEMARDQALYLTDKMAYELNLNDEQYNYCYEINLDYLMTLNTADDVYGPCLTYRNADLRNILYDWQYSLFIAADYFFHPVYWRNGGWFYPIYSYYRPSYFFYSHPHVYLSYRGGHSRFHFQGGFYVNRPSWRGGFRGMDRARVEHRGGINPRMGRSGVGGSVHPVPDNRNRGGNVGMNRGGAGNMGHGNVGGTPAHGSTSSGRFGAANNRSSSDDSYRFSSSRSGSDRNYGRPSSTRDFVSGSNSGRMESGSSSRPAVRNSSSAFSGGSSRSSFGSESRSSSPSAPSRSVSAPSSSSSSRSSFGGGSSPSTRSSFGGGSSSGSRGGSFGGGSSRGGSGGGSRGGGRGGR